MSLELWTYNFKKFIDFNSRSHSRLIRKCAFKLGKKMSVGIVENRNTNNDQLAYPSDINKVVGKLNLLLIDLFCKIRSFFNEFSQRSFCIYKDFFKDIDPIAEKLSFDLKIRLYKCSKRVLLEKSFDEQNVALPKDIAKVLGKISLVSIDVFSKLRAFFKVLFKRAKNITFKGFFKSAEITFLKFSYETKLRVYSYSKGIKLSALMPPIVEEISQSEEATQPPSLSSPVAIQTDLEETLHPEIVIADAASVRRDEESSPTTRRRFKKRYILVAILGIAILWYYISPIIKAQLYKIRLRETTETFTKRFFYIWNKTKINCVETEFSRVLGRPCPIEISSRHLSINCRGLSGCECKDLCHSLS